jgi:hypothetical protein
MTSLSDQEIRDLGKHGGDAAIAALHRSALLTDDPHSRNLIAINIMTRVIGASTAYIVALHPQLAEADAMDIAIEIIKLAQHVSKGGEYP